MFFNSLHYAIFLPLVVAFYFLLPPKRRWIFLLGASYYFYLCWKMEYIVLIVSGTWGHDHRFVTISGTKPASIPEAECP